MVTSAPQGDPRKTAIRAATERLGWRDQAALRPFGDGIRPRAGVFLRLAARLNANCEGRIVDRRRLMADMRWNEAFAGATAAPRRCPYPGLHVRPLASADA